MLQYTRDMHSNQSPLLLGALHLTLQIAKYRFIHTFMYIVTKAGQQHLMSILKGSQGLVLSLYASYNIMAINFLQTDSPAMLLSNYVRFSLPVCALVSTSLFMSACCNRYSRFFIYLLVFFHMFY